jgi:hypothetical protein
MLQMQQAQRQQQQNPASLNSMYQDPFNGFSLMTPPGQVSGQAQNGGGFWPFSGHSGNNQMMNGSYNMNANPWATNPFLASYSGARRLAGY